MATLKDLWNYPNNASSGYLADTSHWSGDNSYGADKRIEDFLTGTYRAWPGKNPRTDFSTTTLAGSTAMARYKHYLDSFSDFNNLTFAQMYNHEMVEWQRGHSGLFVEKIELITDGTVSNPSGSNNLVKVTTTTPHSFADGDRLQGFGFRDIQGSSLTSLNYEENIYAKVVDSTSFTLFANSSLTNGWTYNRSNFIAPLTNYYLLDYKGTNTYLCFSEIGRTAGSHDAELVSQSGSFLPSDKVKISTAHTGLTGTINGSVGDEWTINQVGPDTGREGSDQVHAKSYLLNKTITSETNYATTLSYNIVSNSSKVNIEVDLTSSSYAALRTQLMTYHMHNNNYNIYQVNDGIHDSSAPSPIAGGTGSGMGFCRVSLTQGATLTNYTGGGAWDSNSDKPIKSSLDTEYFYNWTYNDTTKMLKVYENALGTARLPLGAVHESNIQGEIQFINFWTQAQTGPNSYNHGTYAGAITHSTNTEHSGFTAYPVITFPDNFDTQGTFTAYTVGWQGIDGVADDGETVQKRFDSTQPGGPTLTSLTKPMIGHYNSFVPTATRFFNSWGEPDDVMLGIVKNPTHYWTGAQKYTYQNSSNVATNGAGNIDFNTVYKNDGSTTSSLTWNTAPVITPGVDSSGYLDGTYTYTNLGALSWSSLGVTTNADIITKLNTPSDSIYITGSYKFQQRADEYTAPTPYAEDVWDTETAWDSESWGGADANQWPKHVTPRSIKVIQAVPSSVTTSQSGIKYVRASGIIRHQLEVEYPPMNETDFREFESVHAAARGQATPMYFDFFGYGSGSDVTLAFNRIDDAGASTPGKIPAKETSAIGSKYMLAEGFEANKSQAIIKGEFLVGGGSLDGGLIQAVSEADSNVFGEVKFRMAVGLRSAFNPGDHMYTRPLHAIVTIAEDTLEYTIGTDQLYRFSIRFDWDTWK